MDNPKYIQVMRQVASDFDGISHELFQVASDLERMDQYNPQQKLFSLVRSAEVSSVTLRNLTARTVRDDTAPFYCEVADLLGIKVEETHDWLKISVPAILPKRNQRDNQAFLTRPLRYAIMDYLKENPMERFGSCAICIVHNYLSEEALRKYSFSTLVWYHLRSELSNYARDQVGKLQEIPIEFYCELPAPEIAPVDDGLWRVIEDNLTYKQFEAIQFRNQGYTNREIAELCGVGRKAIEKRFARIRKILSDYKEN